MNDAEPAEAAVAPEEHKLEASLPELVLEIASPGLVPAQDLAPDPATLTLLAPVASLAVTLLTEHRKSCRRPKTCPEIPPVLRKYLTMRPHVAAHHVDSFARALVDVPEHGFTSRVRDAWQRELANDESGDAGLEEQIANGAMFTSDGLRAYFGDTPRVKAQLLASTLWARGLRTEAERSLFRLLGPIGAAGLPGQERHEPSGESEPRKTEPSRRKAQRDERREVERLEAALKALRREQRRLNEQITRATSDKEAVHAALDAALSNAEKFEERVKTLERELRVARAEASAASRDMNRAAATAEQLRAERDVAASGRSELERAQNRVVGELARKNRELEALRAKLIALPSGGEAVHAFMVEEEARIDQELQIAQGGDQQRAAAEHAAHRKLERAFLSAYPEFSQPRPAVVARRLDLSLRPLGGADEVGRSAYLLRIGERRVLVDCGIKIGKKHLEDLAPALDTVESLDAVILTHAHTDHIGWLPAVVHRFPEVPVYCTVGTADLAQIMLSDCHRHHLVSMAKLRSERAHSTDLGEIEDPYDTDDVVDAQLRLIGCEYEEPETLEFGDVNVTFLRSGHILGAASVLIEGGDRRVLMSGDISTEAQHTVGTADWSSVSGDLDLLVLESTYGAEPRESLSNAQEELVSFIGQRLEDGGSVILPCFALGRGQEVEALLAHAMEAGHLPPVTVWIDGMIRDINEVYFRHQQLFRLPKNFMAVSAPPERAYVVEEARRQPTIIVTTSGMLAGGPAVDYARQLLPDPKHRIAFTGYQDEGNPGHALLKLAGEGLAARVVKVENEEGEVVEIRATAPARKFSLSAHADQRGLVDAAMSVNPRTVVLVHGYPRTQERLRDVLQPQMARSEVLLGSTGEYTLP